jgi:hypothetical protein
MVRPLWKLVLKDPSSLTCDECFAVMEYYAELLAGCSTNLLPKVIEHLKECPACEARHREVLSWLVASQSETGIAALSDSTEPNEDEAEGI